MDDCPICFEPCYVVVGKLRNHRVGFRANDNFVCYECLVQWPSTGPKIPVPFGNSPISRALPLNIPVLIT